MRLALVQFDAVVGDIAGNAQRIAQRAAEAAARGADAVAFPELALCGYPPRDLLQRQGIAAACEAALTRIAQAVAASGPAGARAAVLVGAPRAVGTAELPLANGIALLRGGAIEAWYEKRLLPDYDVFDEPRHFRAGAAPLVFECAGARIGVGLCEDLWRAHDVGRDALAQRYGAADDPLAEAVAAGAQAIVVLSASPFAAGKPARHAALVAQAAARLRVPVASINAAGADDDLLFDADARVAYPDGRAIAAPRWQEATLTATLPADPAAGAGAGDATATATATTPDPDADTADRWHALVAAIAGYFRKTGHRQALLGLSGGIDSALVGALAAAALGGPQVLGVLMPSRYSSEGSRADAVDLARRCGMRTMELSIEPAHASLAAHLEQHLRAAGLGGLQGLADENLQSRLRGLQLMALSNATGALVLATGNKSEYAVGYSTLYGDMCGALAPIGDLLKTQVWALSRWANQHHAALGFAQPPIPQPSIDKPPSAELRPDQTDQDTLPPYEQLDAIVQGWVEQERSVEAIVAQTGIAREVVERWTRAIDLAQYKRAQAPVIPKLSARAFGPGRRLPIVARWRPT
ncbi:MAG: NAD+ synthase [Phycisphaerales bacterium]